MEIYYAYLKLLVALPVVILLAYYGLPLVMRRFAPSLGMGRRVQVIERTALNARTFLYVVKAGKNYLLLAVSQAGVTLLKDLGDDWEEGYEEEMALEGAQEQLNFGEVLGKLKGKKAGGDKLCSKVTDLQNYFYMLGEKVRRR